MKNIVLTTLFAGCFVVSSVMADEAKSGFDFGAKVRAGVAFASKVKAEEVTTKDSSGSDLVVGVAYGTSGSDANHNASAEKNTKKKSSAFIGVVLGTKYNFNNMFALGGEIFYDAMNVKFELKEGKSGMNDTAKIRGRYGIMATFAFTPLDNMSFDFGIGIAKTTKIKDLHVYSDLTTEEAIKELNGIKFKNKIGLMLKAGANYIFNQNLSLGLDLTMQKVKAKDKKYKVVKFKSNLYTIGASLNYTF